MKSKFSFNFFSKTKDFAKKLTAFTVAEILIALAGIGFISTITLGTVTKQIEAQKNIVSKTILNNEFAVALADMHSDKALENIKSQKEFADKIQKYLGVEGDVVNKNGTYSQGDSTSKSKPLPFSDFAKKHFASSYTDETGNAIKAENYNTLFKTSKGASVAISYIDGCRITSKFVTDSSSGGINKYDFTAKNEALTCVSGFYDVNGPAGPNKFGQDMGYFNEIKGNCTGAYAMDANGKCSICTVTNANCKASNKTLDKESCSCKCTRKCPKGLKLDPDTCSCKCTVSDDFNENYCRKPVDDEATLSCKPILLKTTTPAKCTVAGGKWNNDKCNCKCTDVPVPKSVADVANANKDECYVTSEGFGERINTYESDKVNGETFCKCRCKYNDTSEAFQKQVKINAQVAGLKGRELTEAVNNTVPAGKGRIATQKGCYACKSGLESTDNITYEVRGGFCAAGCNKEQQDNCEKAGSFFKWLPYNPDDKENSCKCVCNSDVKKAALEGETGILGNLLTELKKYIDGPISKDSSSNHVWANFAQADRICDSGNHGSCYNCGMSQRAVIQNIISSYNNSGKYPSGVKKPKIVFSEEKCAYVLDNKDFKEKFNASGATGEIHFHCRDGNCWGYSFHGNFKKYQLPNPNTVKKENSNDVDTENSRCNSGYVPAPFGKNIDECKDSYWNAQLKVGATYSRWADPIVLNYTDKYEDSTSKLGNYITSADNQKVDFAISYDEKTKTYTTVKTHWLNAKKNINEAHLFLVTKDSSGNVPNISYLFSDQKVNSCKTDGSLYSTGLEQLECEFDATKDSITNDTLYLFESGVVNKNDTNFSKLHAWHDANANAVVDKDEIKTLSDLGITEFNTGIIRETSATGETLQSGNAVYGIKGQYKRLIDTKVYTPTVFDVWQVKCYVDPVYDENGKQILDKWALNDDYAHWNCKNIAEKVTEKIKEGDKEKEVTKYYVKYSPKTTTSGSYKETWFKYVDNYTNTSNIIDTSKYKMIKIYPYTYKDKNKEETRYKTEVIRNLNDIIFRI